MSSDALSNEVSRLQRRAVEQHQDVDGHTGWVAFDLVDHTAPDEGMVVRAEPGVYSGRLGVAVFLAAAQAVTDSDEAVEPLIEDVGTFGSKSPASVAQSLELGMGDGVGSLIYGLSVLAEVSGEDRYERRASRLATALSDERLRSTESYDVIGGIAGTLHALCRLYEQTGDETILTRAVTCGERLLASRIPKWGLQVWDTSHTNQPSFSTGMGHGAAGICHALYRLYGHTGQTAFREAADNALRYENAFYTPAEDNWRANWLTIPEFPNWWCYGTPGIGLARIGSVAAHDADHLRRDRARAAAFEPELGQRDALCHGTFSQVALLTELGRTVDDQYHEAAVELAGRAVARRRASGEYRVACGCVPEVTNHGFFLGSVGIGYQLLRLSAPETLPSVLRFE